MKIKNNVGPKIDHQGTPDFMYAVVDSPLPLSITCWRLCRSDDIKFRPGPWHLYKESLSMRIE